MKRLFAILLLCYVPCSSQSKSNNFNLQKVDTSSIIIDNVINLKEVKKRQNDLHHLKGKNTNISIFIFSKPSKSNPYYYLQVGYDGPLRFEGYDIYRINKKNAFKKPFYKYVEKSNLEGEFIPLPKLRNSVK